MNRLTIWVSVADYYVALDLIKETLGYHWYSANASWPDTNRKRREELLGFVLTTEESAKKVADCLRQGGVEHTYNPED